MDQNFLTNQRHGREQMSCASKATPIRNDIERSANLLLGYFSWGDPEYQQTDDEELISYNASTDEWITRVDQSARGISMNKGWPFAKWLYGNYRMVPTDLFKKNEHNKDVLVKKKWCKLL